jgi:hypothetical protein
VVAVDEEIGEPTDRRQSDARRRRGRVKRDEAAERPRIAREPVAPDDEADDPPADPEPSSAEPQSAVETPKSAPPQVAQPRPRPAPAARETARTAAVKADTRPQAPARPRGPIIVPPNRARREGGSVAPIYLPRWETAPKQITAKLCIDTRGKVTAVSVLSPVSETARTALQRALLRWQYRPILEGDQAVAACFAAAFRIDVR